MFWTPRHTPLPTSDAEADAGAAPSAGPPAAEAATDARLAALAAADAHWAQGAGLCGADSVYFCKADPRLCVRRRHRVLSWTINFAHPFAVWALVTLIVVPTLINGLVNALVTAQAVTRARAERCPAGSA